MTPASQPHVVRLRLDLVRVRQVRPGDASAVVSAYAHLGEQSRYRRVAMQILRHSKIAVTMEIYTEVPSAATRAVLRKLGQCLGS